MFWTIWRKTCQFADKNIKKKAISILFIKSNAVLKPQQDKNESSAKFAKQMKYITG